MSSLNDLEKSMDIQSNKNNREIKLNINCSEFLDDIQANKFLDKFDGEAAYKHKKFNDDLNNAKTYEELEKVGEEHSDLMGAEGEYLDSYTKKLGEIMKEPEVKTEVPKTEIEAPKPKSTGAKRVENPAIEESQTVPKLGTKKVINPDGTERIARTLGDYKAVEFQEIARRPDKLNKLSDISEAVSKTDEEAIDVIADLAKEKKTFENTF